jgi:hypothetical protein
MFDEPLREWVAAGSDFRIKVSDLGSCKSAIVVFPCNFWLTNSVTAFFGDSPPVSPKTPVDVESPELLFYNTITVFIYFIYTKSRANKASLIVKN